MIVKETVALALVFFGVILFLSAQNSFCLICFQVTSYENYNISVVLETPINHGFIYSYLVTFFCWKGSCSKKLRKKRENYE